MISRIRIATVLCGASTRRRLLSTLPRFSCTSHFRCYSSSHSPTNPPQPPTYNASFRDTSSNQLKEQPRLSFALNTTRKPPCLSAEYIHNKETIQVALNASTKDEAEELLPLANKVLNALVELDELGQKAARRIEWHGEYGSYEPPINPEARQLGGDDPPLFLSPLVEICVTNKNEFKFIYIEEGMFVGNYVEIIFDHNFKIKEVSPG